MNFDSLNTKQIEYFKNKVLPLKVKELQELREVAEEGLYDLNEINTYINRYKELHSKKDIKGLYSLFNEIDSKFV